MAYTLLSRPGVATPVKAWIDGVQIEPAAQEQLFNVARLPIVFGWLAVMPDVHYGIGATVGSVVPTQGAIIPAAVGVDIGCGMVAVRTSLRAQDLPDSLAGLRTAIEDAVPHGGPGVRGTWGEPGRDGPPNSVTRQATALDADYRAIERKHPKIKGRTETHLTQLGTLGGGNHFIEVCLDEDQAVWIMLHSGSRGVGNRIGTYFIQLAREDMREHVKNLPDRDLAYLTEGTSHFADYWAAVSWAQQYAMLNRQLMLDAVIGACRKTLPVPFTVTTEAVNCHHNYVARETHFDAEVYVTRKGAVSARAGELGIIPGSMGTRSYIVRGKGNPESFTSCSHGAGRAMSRGAAKRRFSLADHAAATAGVECRKDVGVIDETPLAYKPIDAVIAAEADLVDVVHTLKQVVCVKG
jgi:tRNA-splicing ligase RtcB (3'-phosphate/5'-hydroxy nucleic acid ligase)